MMSSRNQPYTPLAASIITALKGIVRRQQIERTNSSCHKKATISLEDVFSIRSIFDEPEMQELLRFPLVDENVSSQLMIAENVIANHQPNFPSDWLAQVALLDAEAHLTRQL
jgi:hypothetical protein